MVRKIIVCLTMTVAAIGNHRLVAQSLVLNDVTELETNFHKGFKWINLLRTELSIPVNNQIAFELASFSVSKSSDTYIANDLQTFSNIDAGNIPWTLAVLGINWQMKNSSLFIGIRNINEDYFTSPCTALFTNSSCGIFPTISANYPIANYPEASVGIDYKLNMNKWFLETSIYNGTGHHNLSGKENLFRFCPQTDGIFSITSLNYQNYGNSYFMGIALYNGMYPCNEVGIQEETIKTQKKGMSATLWTYAEQTLVPQVKVLAQYSFSTQRNKGCRYYLGSGLILYTTRSEGGLFIDYADFSSMGECACEITWKFPCLKNGYLQPALHFIKNTYGENLIGMIRFGYSLSWNAHKSKSAF